MPARPSNTKHIPALLAPALALLCLLPTPASGAVLGRVQPGDPVPDLELTDQSDAKVDLGPPDGQTHLLFFLRHLRRFEELAGKDLRKLAGNLGDQGLQVHVVWVAPEEDASIPDLELGGSIWFDRHRKAVKALGIIVYPTTVLISKGRKILERIPSRPPNYAMLIETAVKRELGLIDAKEFKRLRSARDEESKPQDGTDIKKARLLASFAGKLARDGKIQQAETEFRRAIKLCGDDPRVAQPYAAFLLDTDRVDEAQALVNRLLEQSPNHTGLRVIRARILAQQGQHEEAAKILEEVLPLTPDKAPLLFELGDVRAAQEQWQAAATLYREALQLLLNDR